MVKWLVFWECESDGGNPKAFIGLKQDSGGAADLDRDGKYKESIHVLSERSKTCRRQS